MVGLRCYKQLENIRGSLREDRVFCSYIHAFLRLRIETIAGRNPEHICDEVAAIFRFETEEICREHIMLHIFICALQFFIFRFEKAAAIARAICRNNRR